MLKLTDKLICNKGQALVETAFALGLFLLFLLGIFEFGRAMYIKNTLTNAARAGARAAVVQSSPPLPVPPNSNYCTFIPKDPCTNASYSNICLNICQSLFSGIPKNHVTVAVTVDNPDGTTATGAAVSGDIIQVGVTWTNFTPLTPLFKGVLGSGLTANAAMRYE